VELDNDDYVQIADFFEKMKEKNPNSKAIDMAIMEKLGVAYL
jgi:hypothetical protein